MNLGRKAASSRRKRSRAEPALSAAKGCPRHSGRDARATILMAAKLPRSSFRSNGIRKTAGMLLSQGGALRKELRWD